MDPGDGTPSREATATGVCPPPVRSLSLRGLLPLAIGVPEPPAGRPWPVPVPIGPVHPDRSSRCAREGGGGVAGNRAAAHLHVLGTCPAAVDLARDGPGPASTPHGDAVSRISACDPSRLDGDYGVSSGCRVAESGGQWT